MQNAQRVELSVIRYLLLVTIRLLHQIEAKHGVVESWTAILNASLIQWNLRSQLIKLFLRNYLRLGGWN